MSDQQQFRRCTKCGHLTESLLCSGRMGEEPHRGADTVPVDFICWPTESGPTRAQIEEGAKGIARLAGFDGTVIGEANRQENVMLADAYAVLLAVAEEGGGDG